MEWLRNAGEQIQVTTRCSARGEADVTTRHARICHPAGAHLHQHQPLEHALTTLLEQLKAATWRTLLPSLGTETTRWTSLSQAGDFVMQPTANTARRASR